MQMLLSWYRHTFAGHGPKIVLYLEDFEAFDPNVLSELLYIIRCAGRRTELVTPRPLLKRSHLNSLHTRSIPFVLLFAIATSTNAIHSLLPRATSELLRVTSFAVTQSSETFHALMADLFIRNSQPLSLGPKVFSVLRDTFLDFDQSIDAVVSKLQVCRKALAPRRSSTANAPCVGPLVHVHEPFLQRASIGLGYRDATSSCKRLRLAGRQWL